MVNVYKVDELVIRIAQKSWDMHLQFRLIIIYIKQFIAYASILRLSNQFKNTIN